MQGASPAHNNGSGSTLCSRKWHEEPSNLPSLLQETHLKGQNRKGTSSQALAVAWWWWVVLLKSLHPSQSHSYKSTLPIASPHPEETSTSMRTMGWSNISDLRSKSKHDTWKLSSACCCHDERRSQPLLSSHIVDAMASAMAWGSTAAPCPSSLV